MIKSYTNYSDYELLDCTDGEKLERFGRKIYIRPDPQIIWKTDKNADWEKAEAHYLRSEKGGGRWDFFDSAAKNAQDICFDFDFGKLTFIVKPTDFKHMGIFPEQAVNWETIGRIITEARGQCGADRQNTAKVQGAAEGQHKESDSSPREINILNLFAYTGGATLAAAKAGAKVCHVDAAKGMVQWAKDNAAKSGLQNAPIRYIVDDCGKFVGREIKRGVRYDGIIMDPPSYGRGPGGETWRLEENLYDMVKNAAKLLSDKPLFFILNSYTTGLSEQVMEYLLSTLLPGMNVTSYVLGLPCKGSGKALPCGSTAIAVSK
jgi:23S rRNA (cytosine1962-C5)-methyltransferase